MRSLIRLKGLTLIASTADTLIKFTKNQRKTLIILTNLVIYSLAPTVVVLEEMFRETLQTLACLSVLAGAYSLHMSTRDQYRNPLNGISLVHLNDGTQTQVPQPRGNGGGTTTNDLNESSATNGDRQKSHLSSMMATAAKTNNKINSNRQQQKHVDIPLFDENNDIPDYSNMMNHEPIGPLMQPPRGLQELFVAGSANKYDIRQQQQQQQSPTSKRSGVVPGMPQMPHGLASQLMLRSQRGQRQYDVPQIECPPAMDGMERFACPSPDRQGRYRCIDDHVLCDGFIDCPGREDEDRQACMFYKTVSCQ